jgi:hypothetical protein
VQADANVLALRDVAAEVLDLVREHVRRRHLDGRRQIDDHLAPALGLPYVDDRVADVDREGGLGAREALRRILERPVDARVARGTFLQQPRAVDGDADDLFFARLEHLLALHRRRRVVDVHDGALDAAQRLESSLDELATGLRQDLHGHVVGNQLLVDEPAREVVLGLRGGRKADLDLLESEVDEQREHLELLRDRHRLDERLVAVAKIDGAPVRRALDRAVGPLAIGERDRAIRLVLAVVEVAHGGSLSRCGAHVEHYDKRDCRPCSAAGCRYFHPKCGALRNSQLKDR